MAELDEIVQKILLEGDSELLSGLEKIGKEGAEHIAQLAEACNKGATPMQALGGAIAIVEAAFATATVALLKFVEGQDEAVLKTALLADAMGTSTGQIQGLEAAFAAAGVSVQTFEKFANRLTISIAQQWPQIADSIRTYATQNDQAQERVVSATIKIKEAQQALANSSDDFASRSAANDSRVEQALIRLQFASQRALQQMKHDVEDVAGATLSLEAAEQRLATLQGHGPSEGEKKALELKQAQLAVDKARQSIADARLTEQQHQAEALQKQKDLEQAAEDAQIKRAHDAEQAQLTRLQLEAAVKNAITSREAADEHAAKLALTSVDSISTALKGIVDGNKAAAKSVDLTQVSVVNLERAIFKTASAGGGQPKGLETLIKLSEVLKNDTEGLISQSERLALVQRLSATSMTNTGVATAELLAALERGPQYFEKFKDAAEKSFSNSKEGIENVKHFKDALTEFNFALALTNQNLAAAASPAFTEFLHDLKESLTSDTGLLHNFVEGIKVIGSAVGLVIQGFKDLTGFIDQTFNLAPGTAMKILLISLVTIVAAFAGWWAQIPAAIALVITFLGDVKTAAGEITDAVKEMWKAFKDNTVVQFLSKVLEKLGLIKSTAADGKTKGVNVSSTGTALDVSTGTAALAGGGEVHGPGTTTSDSVFARLSRGEFVVKAAAVQAYGTDLFHKLNTMAFPGFAQGGLVPAPVRFNGGGSVAAGSTLNLTIGDRTFAGLKGPKDVIDDLASFAIGRQTSATAGNNPTWFK